MTQGKKIVYHNLQATKCTKLRLVFLICWMKAMQVKFESSLLHHHNLEMPAAL